MSSPTRTEQDNLRSRLPDPSRFFPELAGVAGAMFTATRNGSIPQTTISLVQLRAGQIVGSTYHTVRQTGEQFHAQLDASIGQIFDASVEKVPAGG